MRPYPTKTWLARLALPLLAAFLFFGAPTGPAAARINVSVSFFYDELGRHGRWIEHDRHGYVWYPTDIDDEWRPYTRGSWANTDEHGWMWVSEEPWGWATYHYGRWDYDEDYGWYWVPGTEWAPAWVEWRHGDGYVGWAPLPPEVRWRDSRFDYGTVDFYAPRYRPHWVFVRDIYFVSPSLHRHCLPRAQNITYIRRTQTITNYTVVNFGIANRSLNVSLIERATRRPVPVMRVRQVERPSDAGYRGRGFAQGGGGGQRVLPVFRPAVAVDPAARPRNTVSLPPRGDGRPGGGGPADIDRPTGQGPAGSPRTGGTGEQRRVGGVPNVGAPPHVGGDKGPGSRPDLNRPAQGGGPSGGGGSVAQPGSSPGPIVRPFPPGGPSGGPSGSPSGGPSTTSGPGKAPTTIGAPPQTDPRLRQLEDRQARERRQLDSTQSRERFSAPPTQRPDISQRQMQERGELQRIQQQQRNVIQNRPAITAPPQVQQQGGGGGRPQPASTQPPARGQQQPAKKPDSQQGPGGGGPSQIR